LPHLQRRSRRVELLGLSVADSVDGNHFILCYEHYDDGVLKEHSESLGSDGEWASIQSWEDAMGQRSAGILIHRQNATDIEVLLVHPGGPYWANKDDSAWSIPKGLVDPGEDEMTAAKRELLEEIGAEINGEFVSLGELRQPSGKTVVAWAIRGDFDVRALVSNSFEIEWPPRSGVIRTFPEVDRAQWFRISDAKSKILKGQRPFLSALLKLLA
jgi:predicted NUDIX family NTP pyrophosphohydrolase